jgi:hypothetical protein
VTASSTSKAASEREAISVSADTLVIDEFDRMPDMNVVTMFDSRLQAAIEPRRRRFSNGSAIGYGVDALYKDSNEYCWFVACHHCGHKYYIDYEQGVENNHYVDKHNGVFACGKCHKEISDEDRRMGFWVDKWSGKERHGYWISQMMAPWVTAKRIMQQEREMDVATFHGFVLGKAYTPSDLLIDRDTILRAVRHGDIHKKGVVMGSDIGKPHWYWLATPQGIFKGGRAESWDELEYMFNFYQCDAWVMDSMPEFTKVQEMLKKYPGRAYACQFNKDRAAIGALRWQAGDKRGFVYADRTKVIDRTVTDLAAGSLPFYMPSSELDDLIRHASNMYRTVETDPKGQVKIDWQTIEGRPDHLVFALTYTRIALERVFSAVNSNVVEIAGPMQQTVPTVDWDGKYTQKFDVDESIRIAQNSNTH